MYTYDNHEIKWESHYRVAQLDTWRDMARVDQQDTCRGLSRRRKQKHRCDSMLVLKPIPKGNLITLMRQSINLCLMMVSASGGNSSNLKILHRSTFPCKMSGILRDTSGNCPHSSITSILEAPYRVCEMLCDSYEAGAEIFWLAKKNRLRTNSG